MPNKTFPEAEPVAPWTPDEVEVPEQETDTESATSAEPEEAAPKPAPPVDAESDAHTGPVASDQPADAPEASGEAPADSNAALAEVVRGEALPGALPWGGTGTPPETEVGEHADAEPGGIDAAAIEAELDARLAEVANALVDDGQDSGSLSGLAAEAESLRSKVEARAKAAGNIALEPSTTRAQIRAAREEAELARLDVARLDDAIERLFAKYEAVHEAEKAAMAAERFEDATEAERVAWALVMKNAPEIQRLREEINDAIGIANTRIRIANRDLPAGRKQIDEIDLRRLLS